MLRQRQSLSQKTKLSQTLRSWLPILQASLDDLKESLNEYANENPIVSVQESSAYKEKNSKKYFESLSKNSVSDTIEATSIGQKSVYELLDEQIIPPLFPTQRSQEIAYKIIECLNNEGYFEYDEEILAEYEKSEVERIRARFCFLEPVGVGAVDFKEGFCFALQNMELDEELNEYCLYLLKDFENYADYSKDSLYKKALNVFKRIQMPPFLPYFEDSQSVVPDIFIYKEDGQIKVKINDEYYPEIAIETDDLQDEFLSAYIKDAKNLIDALEMRKATLYKVGLMIIEHQYDFFIGKEIKPMKLKDLAEDLQCNASTISRAIANKYLGYEGGLVPLKYFFSTALDEEGETSNLSIKDFIQNLIKEENHKKPLSDEKILALAQEKFNSINIGRRTIAKYRKQLGILSSTDRKKRYELL